MCRGPRAWRRAATVSVATVNPARRSCIRYRLHCGIHLVIRDGEISAAAGQVAIQGGPNVDEVINRGMISGQVLLGAGDDVFEHVAHARPQILTLERRTGVPHRQ